ncbi:MAG: amino acid adenylation domain-containing protein [Streptosporangiaceae bacterium]|jgi:amino acid adenylation domain-containing protein
MMDLTTGRGLVRRWRSAATQAPTAPGPARLSTVQRGVLVFERLHPGTSVFNLHFAARHTGPLDEGRLDAALAAVVARHPALRSSFTEDDSGWSRVIRESGGITAGWTDLRHLPPGERLGAALAHAGQVAAGPFDLEHGPLARLHGIRLADGERLLVFVAHHLVCDGGSMRVLLADLEVAYDGAAAGAPTMEAPTAEAAPGALEYWKTQLAGLPELDLPADRQRPARPTFRAGSVRVALPAELVAAAEDLGRQEKATLFMVVLAAYQLLLAEYSAQQDFGVGVPEAGRSQPGRHRAVGLLSDMLVLRADLSGRPSFRELVRRVRATALAALRHRGVPFEDLVAAIAPGRGLGTAFVRAGLAFHGDWGSPTLGGYPLKRTLVQRPGLRYDVDLHLWREHGGLYGTWDYSAEAFTPATAERMAAQLSVLLSRALACPEQPVDTIDLLVAEDRECLVRWEHGPLTDDPDTTLTELFAAQVARVPDAIAIEDAHRGLTYRGLDERSNQLAQLLRERGVEAGHIVGIRLGRGVDLAVAMLGILRCGAAYLPLDPAYPADRTEYMLADSGARLVVTEAELAELHEHAIAETGIGPASPDQLCYVLYTSGSTGRPKGVLLTHRNAVPMVRWGSREFTPEQLSRVLASTSICFDVSVFEFFVTLCAGGTVVVVENALALLADPPEVSMVCAVPSAARALASVGAFPPSVKVVGLAGEAVTGRLVEDLYATGHVEAVVNLYGPTEDTTYSTCARLLPEEQPPPIGALLPHGRGYVLDRALRQAPVGAAGELYLAGRGLSLGYINQSGLTATRYVPDPFAAAPGERMYRTGDLVRYRPDGSLLYLGRRDFQIKIRGQRIELGEIENTLQRHPRVHEAVVALTDDRLVGYITAREPGACDLDDVRGYLRGTLPVVMVPSSLILLEALPRTPNGKVDRLALPAPAAVAGVGGEPPAGPAEELVADIWREILGLDAVGRDDDFFDVGGDSLLAGQVISRLRARAGVALPLRLVFEHSRLSELAAALPGPRRDHTDPPVVPRSPDAEPVLSFDQQRLWLECQFRPNVAYNVHGRQWLTGALDIALLQRSIRAIVARHESLRTTFHLNGGRPVQRVSEPDPGWQVTVEDLSGDEASAEAAAERLADKQAAKSFDLARGPLFACLLVRLDDNRHLLSMTIHHIVADGRSVAVIMRELSALYRASGDAELAALPDLPVQYRDYAVWQRGGLTGERLAGQVAYWRDQLAGAPPALTLPTARRRSPAQGAIGGKVSVELGAEGAQALDRLCRDHQVTPFMAILAAAATVLRRWSGQDDLVIGVPVDTRSSAAGTEMLVGMFVNTVPLRVRLDGDPVFAEVLDRVRKACLDGYVNHRLTPFEVLVGQLHAVRDPSRTPVFQVLVNMIQSAEKEWQLPGISVRTPQHPAQPSKFDLNLDVLDRGDGYRFDLLYHADRYEATMMRAFLSQVRALLVIATGHTVRGILEYDLTEASPRPTTRNAQLAGSAERGDWAVERFGLTARDRFAFVSGAEGLLLSATTTAEAAGAAMTRPGTATATEPAALLKFLRDTLTTAVYLSAPVLRTLSPTAGPVLPRLRFAFLANTGALTAHDVQLVRRLAPACQVIAVYRPAVAGRPTAVYEVPARWPVETAPLRVPAGFAIDGPATLRNAAGTVAAIGEVADLGGHDPVRSGADGLLEFAGPAGPDPLETVATIRDLPGVRDVAVVPYTDADGHPALAAYIVDPDRSADLRRLRQHLVTRLPEYLVPRRVVALDRLPLTGDGEHDTAALAAVELTAVEMQPEDHTDRARGNSHE